jgi:hypothetical protein
MRTPFRPALARGLLLALLAATPTAHAKAGEGAERGKPSADADQGAGQFSEGRKRFKAGQYAEALPLFEQAFQASHSPNARLYLARTLRELGRLTEAYAELQATLDEARSRAETEPRYVETRDASAAELALLEPKVSKLVVALSGSVPGAEVTIDGVSLAPERIGRSVVLLPGKKTVVATAPGKAEVRKEVTLAGGSSETLALSLDQPMAATAPAPAPTEPEAGAGPLGPVRIAGIAAAGLGVVSLVVFAVSAAQAKSSFDSLNSQCGGQRCTDPTTADEVDQGETMQTLSHVTLGIGLVAAVAGGLMIGLGGLGGETEQTAGLAVGPGRALLRYGLRF